MADGERYSVRDELLGELLRRVQAEKYPSAAMLNLVEGLLTDEEVPVYVAVLLSRIQKDRYPSVDLIRRVHRFV